MSRAGTSIACVILGGRTPCYQRRRILVNGDRGVPAILAVVAVLAFGTCVRIRCAIVLLAASASATPTTPVTSASTLRLFASVLAATLWMEIIISSNCSSTSSRVHESRSEFCDISKPEVPTPPALEALPGANKMS